jgi:DNA-binding NarL/FixJ family response regulator
MQIVIADSSEVFRRGLKSLLHDHRSDWIIDEADTNEAMAICLETLKPDILLIDYTASGFGIDSIRKSLQINSNCKIISITCLRHGMSLIRAAKAGVMSFVKKDCGGQEIVEAVVATGNGEAFFCNQIIEVLKRESINVNNVDLLEANCDPVSISKREKEVIQLIAEGYTNSQIADKLFISSHTVTTHRKNIMQKLGVSNTASIVMYAVKTGLASPEQFLFASPS